MQFKSIIAVLLLVMLLGGAVAQESEDKSHNGLGSWLFGYGMGRARSGWWGRPWGYGGYGGYGGWGRGYGGYGGWWKHNARADSESIDE